MTRHPETYDGPAERGARGRGRRRTRWPRPLAGRRDRLLPGALARRRRLRAQGRRGRPAFATAAAARGVRQIVYMGGLGDDNEDMSAHLRSRREVEALLGETGIPVTVLRAAIVVGHGGISWELTRQLVKNLPAMVVPRWAAHPHAADRRRRRGALPRRGLRSTTRRSGRSSRSAGPTSYLRRDAARRRRRSTPVRRADRRGAGADAAAVVVLAGAGDRRRRHHRAAT